jgi:hypothetical protein
MMPLFAVLVGVGDLLLTNRIMHRTVLLDKVVYDAFLMLPSWLIHYWITACMRQSYM